MLRLTTNNEYTMKLVIGDGERVQGKSVNGNASANSLRFWIDTDDDGDWSDETALLDTTTIDDVWSAGHVGLFRGSVANAQSFDDFEAGIDANADLDIADGGDEVVSDDDFATNVVSLTYDNNGTATDDGIHKHVYDSWNRKVKTTWRVKSTPSTLTTFSYDARGRLLQTAITNSGVENRSMDGGNTTVRALYNGASVLEERNGSNQVVRHQLHASDGPVFVEVNGDPSIGNDVNADATATGEGTESPADKRYFFAKGQGRKNVTALTEYTSGGGGNNGRIKERFANSPGGPSRALAGDSGSGEMLSNSATSSVGVTPAGGWQGPMTEWAYGYPGWVCCRNWSTGDMQAHFGWGCHELGATWEATMVPVNNCEDGTGGTGGPVITTGTIDGPISGGPVIPGGPCGGGPCAPTETIDTTSFPPPWWWVTPWPPIPCANQPASVACAAAEGMSPEEWCEARAALNEYFEDNPWNPWNTACGYSVAAVVIYDILPTLFPAATNDKWRHCVVGCMIGNDCGAEVGCMMGAQKELNDLTDCDPSTNFDMGDSYATCDGSQAGASGGGLNDCVAHCDSRWPRR